MKKILVTMFAFAASASFLAAENAQAASVDMDAAVAAVAEVSSVANMEEALSADCRGYYGRGRYYGRHCGPRRGYWGPCGPRRVWGPCVPRGPRRGCGPRGPRGRW